MVSWLTLLLLSSAYADVDRGFHDLIQDGTSALPMPGVTIEQIHELDQTWDSEEEQQALIGTSPTQRRLRIFRHYGFEPNPYRPELPLGIVEDSNGVLGLNCLACHTTRLNGEIVYGLTNWRLDLRSFVEDLAKQKPGSSMALKPFKDLFGPQRGLINPLGAVLASLTFRKANMDLTPFPRWMGTFETSLSDTPVWWNINEKSYFFSDGAYPLNPRIFVTVAASPLVPGDTYRSRADDVEHILDFVRTLEPPAYPATIDPVRAAFGRITFEQTCARCHGSEGMPYPNRVVPLARIGTDPERLAGEQVGEAWEFLRDSWIGQYGDTQIRASTGGYVAPPLKGVWATAPYFHNGSVPTLEDVLNPESRPTFWIADDDEYDFEKVGLKVTSLARVDRNLTPWMRRRIYDTTPPGRTNMGHPFGAALSPEERQNVIEYLKTR